MSIISDNKENIKANKAINNFDTLLAIEKMNSQEDTFRVKKMYVDIADDLNAGILLGQIIYWYLPSKNSSRTKLRVKKQGKLWLAKQRSDWHDEIRLTARQFDRAFKKLADKDLVVKNKFMFNAKRTIHIRLQINNLIEAVNEHLEDIKQEMEQKDPINADTSRSNQTVKGDLPNGKSGLTESVRPITERTTENTHKEKVSNSSDNFLADNKIINDRPARILAGFYFGYLNQIGNVKEYIKKSLDLLSVADDLGSNYSKAEKLDLIKLSCLKVADKQNLGIGLIIKKLASYLKSDVKAKNIDADYRLREDVELIKSFKQFEEQSALVEKPSFSDKRYKEIIKQVATYREQIGGHTF